MKKHLILLCLLTAGALFAFVNKEPDDPVPVPPSKQRLGGDPQKGYDYLVNGDYVRSGIPYQFYLLGAGTDTANYLHRSGLNAKISHQFTAVKAANGETVVAPNCLHCHAQVFDGQLIVGLGNSLADFTNNEMVTAQRFTMLEALLKAKSPAQAEAALEFIRASKAIAGQLYVPTKGVNVAGRLTELLAAHRDPLSLQWNEEAGFHIPADVVPSDTPPWWILKKKNGMFYNGFGRGDFGRFLMASNLLTTKDSAEARAVDEHMPDVLAYLYSLKPPRYPKPIDQKLAARGKVLFEQNCSDCHGSYGKNAFYPNYLIPATVVKTDPALYRSNYSSPQLVNWFNRSWFTQGDHPARLEPFEGYMAPPLDGVWITAPYLHNGSVPTLEALLNSKSRPQMWSRDFAHPQYDYEHVGWKYTAESSAGSSSVYNTTLPGYGAYGHTFGDVLTDKERKAVIEYLKTL